ncbi:MAG: hypothetical protein ACTSUB_03595 [Candidatus Thorarchaeota archaeon]
MNFLRVHREFNAKVTSFLKNIDIESKIPAKSEGTSEMELERALTKLRYDESVNGYALLTNTGYPFLSFSLPEETLPVIQGTLRIHAAALNLMNIMTNAGTVVLARVDSNWILAVLFISDETLGSALQKTQNVVRLLEDTILPSPPDDHESVDTSKELEDSPTIELPNSIEPEPEIIPLDQIEVRHGCIVFPERQFSQTMIIDSEISIGLKEQFSHVGMDILMMVDSKKTAAKIAESLDRPLEKILGILKWCISRSIVRVECPEEQLTGKKEIIELPLFEGDLKKAKKEHRKILEQCDGEQTLQNIAKFLGIEYFQALQSIIPYRGKSLKMIQKTL